MKADITKLVTVKHYADSNSVSTTYIYRLIREKKMDAVIIDGVQFVDTSKFPSLKN